MNIDDLKAMSSFVNKLKAVKDKLASLEQNKWEGVDIDVKVAGARDPVKIAYKPDTEDIDPAIREVILAALRAFEATLEGLVYDLAAKGGSQAARVTTVKKSKRAVEV